MSLALELQSARGGNRLICGSRTRPPNVSGEKSIVLPNPKPVLHLFKILSRSVIDLEAIWSDHKNKSKKSKHFISKMF